MKDTKLALSLGDVLRLVSVLGVRVRMDLMVDKVNQVLYC
jgi:hypothetical protein